MQRTKVSDEDPSKPTDILTEKSGSEIQGLQSELFLAWAFVFQQTVIYMSYSCVYVVDR